MEGPLGSGPTSPWGGAVCLPLQQPCWCCHWRVGEWTEDGSLQDTALLIGVNEVLLEDNEVKGLSSAKPFLKGRLSAAAEVWPQL